MYNRYEEVRELIRLSPPEIIKKAGDNLIVCKDLDVLYLRFAEHIFNTIKQRNEINEITKIILPIGPTRQYPILVDLINRVKLSLDNCWFFFMDEYCAFNGKVLDESHPLSFKGIANNNFIDLIENDCNLNRKQIIFPNETNINSLADLINELGGIDVCYGGIGIHGHLAFNEPEEGVEKSNPRKVRLNNYTVTINAIRSQIGGNLENFPTHAFTLGMKQILDSKKIRLYCRNGSPYDWANCVLRISLFGYPDYDYPVTYIRNHPDYMITTDWDTLRTPKYII